MINNFQHVGILGMKWGHRKSGSNSSSRSSEAMAKASAKKEKLLRSAIKEGRIRQKGVTKLSQKDFSKLANSPEMANKLRKYETFKQKQRIAGAAVLTAVALMYAGPSIYKFGDKVYRFSGAYKYQQVYEKYGGHAAETVINAKFH